MKSESPLSQTLFVYVEKENAEFAKAQGKKLFGSVSSYVNAILARERNVEPALGKWQPPGVSEQRKKERNKMNRKRLPKVSEPILRIVEGLE